MIPYCIILFVLVVPVTSICFDSLCQFTKVHKGATLLSGLQIIGELEPVETKTACALECNAKPHCHGFVRKGSAKKCLFLSNKPFGNQPYIYLKPDKLFLKNSSVFDILAFRVGSAINPLERYASSSYSNVEDVTRAANFTVRQYTTYKSPAIENWSTFTVRQVILSYRKSDGDWGEIVFNTDAKSSKMNWMRQELLVSTPWKDLNKTSPTVDFGLYGLKGYGRRQFYFMRNHGGCDLDYGYFMVLGKYNDICSWADQVTKSIPVILYSPFDTGLTFSHKTFGIASEFIMVLRVSVK